VYNVKRTAKNVQYLSSIFRDHPRRPLEQAVYWTEYVIRHKVVRHMRSAVLDLAWYQYFLLDVIAVLAIVAVWDLVAVY
jgi:glucuronosyltransferase